MRTSTGKFKYWFADAATRVAYVDTGQSWVAAGVPTCIPQRWAHVSREFTAAAALRGRRAAWFGVEQGFMTQWQGTKIKIGEQPVWNPKLWSQTVAKHPRLLRQVRRPVSKGLIIERVPAYCLADPNSTARVALAEIERQWLGQRRTRPLAFTAMGTAAIDDPGRRVYCATIQNRPVAALYATPLTDGGWLIELVPRLAQAPNGTVECLIDAAMNDFATSGATFATAGLTPLCGIHGFVWQTLRWLASPFYNFAGLRRFRERLRPLTWEPLYLCASGVGTVSQGYAVWDALTALARGRVWSFAVQSVWHRAVTYKESPGPFV